MVADLYVCDTHAEQLVERALVRPPSLHVAAYMGPKGPDERGGRRPESQSVAPIPCRASKLTDEIDHLEDDRGRCTPARRMRSTGTRLRSRARRATKSAIYLCRPYNVLGSGLSTVVN
jgi:hypothetical protein